MPSCRDSSGFPKHIGRLRHGNHVLADRRELSCSNQGANFFVAGGMFLTLWMSDSQISDRAEL